MLKKGLENLINQIMSEDIQGFISLIGLFSKDFKSQKSVYVFLNKINGFGRLKNKINRDSIMKLNDYESGSFSFFLDMYMQSGGSDDDVGKVRGIAKKIDQQFEDWDSKKNTCPIVFLENILAGTNVAVDDLYLGGDFLKVSDLETEATLLLVSLFLVLSSMDVLIFKKFFLGKKFKDGLSVRPISFGWIMMKQPSPLRYSLETNGDFKKKNSHKAGFTNPTLVLSWILSCIAHLDKDNFFPSALYGVGEFFDILNYQFSELDERSRVSFLKKYKEGGKPISLFNFLWLLNDDEDIEFFNLSNFECDLDSIFNLDINVARERAKRDLRIDEICIMLWFIYRIFFWLYQILPKNQAILFGSYATLWNAQISVFEVTKLDTSYMEWPKEIKQLAQSNQFNEPTTDDSH